MEAEERIGMSADEFMVDIICISKVLQATFPYLTVTGYDAHQNNASRPLSTQTMTEKRKSSLRHPNALWHSAHIILIPET